MFKKLKNIYTSWVSRFRREPVELVKAPTAPFVADTEPVEAPASETNANKAPTDPFTTMRQRWFKILNYRTGPSQERMDADAIAKRQSIAAKALADAEAAKAKAAKMFHSEQWLEQYNLFQDTKAEIISEIQASKNAQMLLRRKLNKLEGVHEAGNFGLRAGELLTEMEIALGRLEDQVVNKYNMYPTFSELTIRARRAWGLVKAQFNPLFAPKFSFGLTGSGGAKEADETEIDPADYVRGYPQVNLSTNGIFRLGREDEAILKKARVVYE